MLYWSNKNRGFFDSEIHKNLPEDCIQVPTNKYKELMDDVSKGFIICVDTNNNVISVLPEKQLSAPARALRNKLRDNIDLFLRPASTIKDSIVTQEVKDQLIEDSILLARWPSTEGWPFVPLPPLSDTALELLGNPVWEFDKWK